MLHAGRARCARGERGDVFAAAGVLVRRSLVAVRLGLFTVHVMSCTHVESVTSPAAEHDVSPDSVYPLAHTGVHDVPGPSVPSLQLPFPVPRLGLPVPSVNDTVQPTHVATVNSPAAEHEDVVTPVSL